MSQKITRRDFIKLAALLPAANSKYLQTLNHLVLQPAPESQPNILMVILDALTARQMSLYGYARDTTPNINKFAQKALVFHNHHAGGSFTTPGTGSLLTGAYPWSHRAYNLEGMVSNSYIPRNLFNQAPAGTARTAYSHNHNVIPLLYQFTAFLDQMSMPRKYAIDDLIFADRIFPNDYNVAFSGENITLRLGKKNMNGSLFISFLNRWLEQMTEAEINKKYRSQYPKGVPNEGYVFYDLAESIDQVNQEIIKIPRPFLGYYHFLPPHAPYLPPKEYNKLFNDNYAPPEKPESFASTGEGKKSLRLNRQAYDQYLAYADFQFSRMLEALEQQGLLGDTIVILTSDHGELFERGIKGHVTPVMYEPLVHIPLVISGPGIDSRQDIYSLTSCLDIMATISAIYGQAIPEWCSGQILPGFSSQTATTDRAIFAMDFKDNSKFGQITKGTIMVIQGDFKLVHYLETPEYDELFNLTQDPEELENLITVNRQTAAELLSLINQELGKVNKAQANR